MTVINLGFFSIHIYSICILLGMLIAYRLIIKESKKQGFREEEISDL